MKYKTFFVALVVSFSCMAFGAKLHAAGQQNIAISPSSVEMSIAPGATSTGNISVLNGGATNLDISFTSEPYRVVNEQYSPDFTPIEGTVDASKWVTIDSPSTITLEPQKIRLTNFVIAVPKNTSPGGYYAVVFAKTLPDSNSNVQSSSRVGTILYITVKGSVLNEGSIVLTPVGRVTITDKVSLRTQINNTGGIHYIADTHLYVKNIFGKTSYSSDTQRYLLPQTIRDVSVDWKPSFFGIYHVTGEALIAGKKVTLFSGWFIVVRPIVIILFLVVMCAAMALRVGVGKLRRKKRKS